MAEQIDSRRSFLKSSLAAAVAAAVPAEAAEKTAAKPATQPNIILYLSDQFRWDFIGANGRNGSTRTPNLDAMASRGKNFTHTKNCWLQPASPNLRSCRLSFIPDPLLAPRLQCRLARPKHFF
jgi:TAT (twin-arginine translocation) pathway signal sequence